MAVRVPAEAAGGAANFFSGLVHFGFASMFVLAFGWGAIDPVRGMGG